MIDFFIRLLFESLPLLLAAEALAIAIAVAWHRRQFTARSRRGIWITLAVCAALLALQAIVVTDREALQDMVERLASAVDEGDIGAIGDEIDASFATRGWNRQELLDRSNQTLQRWQVDAPRVGGFQIDVQGDEATVSFRALCDIRGGGEMTQPNLFTRWKLRCVRRQDGWKVSAIQNARIGPADFSGQGGIDILDQLR